MSSFAYPNLAASVDPSMQAAPAPVDQVMPQPETAPENYLHSLGQMLQDSQQKQANTQHAPQGKDGNQYRLDNDANPYSVEPPNFSQQGQQGGAGMGDAAAAAGVAGAGGAGAAGAAGAGLGPVGALAALL